MKPKNRIVALMAILSIIVLVIEAVTIITLYRAAMREERARLEETAKSAARLIEAVARFDSKYSNDYPAGSRQATIDQIRDAHDAEAGFGATGEFNLAKRENDRIVYLLRQQQAAPEGTLSVPWDSALAEPMRQALLGRSGTIIGLDYRGMQVLAAYEPVPALDLGIVTKIDLSEIRAPFIRAAVVSSAIAMVLIVFGAVLIVRITSPMMRELGETVEKLRTALGEQKITEKILSTAERMAHIGSWHLDIDRNKLTWTDEVYSIFGRAPQEFAATYEAFLETVHPGDRELVDRAYRTAVAEGRPYEVVHRIVRPDGEVRTVRERSENVADASGRIVHSFGMVHDITEAQRSEKEREGFIAKLQQSLAEIKTLRGIIPICSYCKKIRDDKGYWDQVEVYVRQHTEADFSHGICPDCLKVHFPGLT